MPEGSGLLREQHEMRARLWLVGVSELEKGLGAELRCDGKHLSHVSQRHSDFCVGNALQGVEASHNPGGRW